MEILCGRCLGLMGKEKPVLDVFIAVADKGGVENVINTTGAYLAKQGWRVRVVQEVWEHHPWTCEDIEFYWLSDDRKGQDSEKFKDRYVRFLKENGTPDLILATNWPMMSWIARQVVEELALSCPIVSWLHNPIDRYVASGYGGTEMLQFADAHLAINQRIAGEISGSIPGTRVFRVNNPVLPDRAIYSEQREAGRLFFAGRLMAQKNLGVLLEGVAQSRSEWELTIVGEGDEKHALEKQSRKLGIEKRVHFLGWQDNPWMVAKSQTFFAMSSLFEGFPVTAIEALLSGLPVISTPVDGIVELIRPGENGYLYPQNDSSALAEVLDYIADGILPIPSADVCRNSAESYLSENALRDFQGVLEEILDHGV